MVTGIHVYDKPWWRGNVHWHGYVCGCIVMIIDQACLLFTKAQTPVVKENDTLIELVFCPANYTNFPLGNEGMLL